MKLYFFDTARCIHKAVPNLVPKIPGYLRVSHSRDTKQPTVIGCVHNTARAHRERPHAPLRVLRERRSVHQLSSVLRLLYPMTVDRTTVASVIPADIVMLSFLTDHYLS